MGRATLTDHAAGQIVAYRDMQGNHWKNSIWEIVLHVVNHGTHHRGQVAGFLRAMGHTPPTLDLMAFYRAAARSEARARYETGLSGGPSLQSK